jgi:hypothetical protein
MLFSCKKENALDCFKSNGSEIIESRDPGNFRIIRVFDKIDLIVKKGPEYKLELSAGKNLLSNISTSNSKGILSIENNNKCNFVRGYKQQIVCTVTVPRIDTLENHGVGTIRMSEDFNQETIFVRAESSGDIYLNGTYNIIKSSSHGNGDIYISGECNQLFGYTFGTNALKAQNLKVNSYIFIETISIGDVHVWAPENGVLECNIWRSGNVFYRGNPAIINDFSNGSARGRLLRE